MNQSEIFIPNPVRIAFDPLKAEETIQTICSNRTARTLWLSWRVGLGPQCSILTKWNCDTLSNMSKSSDYPHGWDEFAAEVKKEMGWRCERCTHVHDPAAGYCLTVHHLTNNKQQPFTDRWAFAALCQRCHLKIQARVQMDQLFFDSIIAVSDWFKPHWEGYLKAQEAARAAKMAAQQAVRCIHPVTIAGDGCMKCAHCGEILLP